MRDKEACDFNFFFYPIVQLNLDQFTQRNTCLNFLLDADLPQCRRKVSKSEGGGGQALISSIIRTTGFANIFYKNLVRGREDCCPYSPRFRRPWTDKGFSCTKVFIYATYAVTVWIPYARHYNPLLIRNRSWILTIRKARILRKKPHEKTFLDFKKWVKSIQTAV